MVRRFVCLVLVLWVSMATSLAASPTLTYESPHTELSYRYVMQEEGSRAELWIYRFRTESGGLQMTVRVKHDRYTVTSDLKGEKSSEVVSMAAPTGAGMGEIELSWPDLRLQARYVKHEGSDELEHLQGGTPDCESLVAGKLAMTQQALLARVRNDYVRYVEPPRHLEELARALYVARYLPLLAAECEVSQEPAGGACYYDNPGYVDCLACCESDSGIANAVCGSLLWKLCFAPWCRGLGAGLCHGAVVFGSGICAGHNCRGKPGDPHCDQNQVCEGRCMNFCGPGWSSGCGSCAGEDSYHQECCR